MIKVNSKNLQEALKQVGMTCPTNPYRSELKSVLLETVQDTLVITSTDLESTTQVKIQCESDENTKFLVDHRTLSTYLGTVIRSEVEFININLGDKIVLKAKGIPSLNLPVLDVDFFPSIETPKEVSFEIQVSDLLLMLSCVDFVSANTIPLTGIAVHGEENIIFEATDGFTGKRIITEKRISGKSFIVPATLHKSRALFMKEESVNVSLDSNTLYIYKDDWFLRYQLIDKKYPNTEKGYMNSSNNVIYLNKQELTNVLDTLKLAGETLTLCIERDTISFLVTGVTSASHIIEIPSGELPCELKIDIAPFTKILKNMTEDTVKIKIGSGNQPVIIEQEDGTVYFMVVRG
jgi:DNA polymerase III sliding clamp (beta) subunit (PCNA family)